MRGDQRSIGDLRSTKSAKQKSLDAISNGLAGELAGVLRFSASIRFWGECILFFILATHFELANSGVAYLIKLISLVLLCASATQSDPGRITSSYLFAPTMALMLVLANIVNFSDRALLAVLLIVVAPFYGQMVRSGFAERFLAILTVYIVFHLIGILLGAALYFLRGEVVDLHAMLFAGTSRAEDVRGVLRLSGFQVEPGNYAQWALMTVFFRSLLMGKILSLFNVIIASSVLLTLSLWGFLGLALFVTAVVLEMMTNIRHAQRGRILLSLAVLVVLGTVVWSNIPEAVVESAVAFLDQKASMKSETGLNKLWAMEAFKQSVVDILVVGQPMVPGLCPECLAPQDTGAFVNMMFYCGIFPTMLFLSVVAFRLVRSSGIRFVPLFWAMLLWKAVFYDPLLWAMIGWMMLGSRGESHWDPRYRK